MSRPLDLSRDRGKSSCNAVFRDCYRLRIAPEATSDPTNLCRGIAKAVCHRSKFAFSVNGAVRGGLPTQPVVLIDDAYISRGRHLLLSVNPGYRAPLRT